MAEVILAEIRFLFDNGETTANQLGLIAGETYRIVWDGTEYTDTAVEATLMGYQAIVVGNTALAGGENSGNYPFLLGDVVEIEMGYFIAEDKSAAAHTVAIYTAESSEFAPNDIILKRYSGEEKVFKGVDVVRLTHASNEYTVPYTFGEAVENIPITLDLKDGDQTVTAPEGTLVKSAVIAKPVNLTPENIRSGKTIAGVTGEFVGESEPLVVGTSEGAVALDWSAGDQIITPVTDGKPFSPVTLEKPATLLPENIAEGIDIAGIIGTFAGGGGGEYSVTVIDYDGTVIAEQHLDEGETCILPEAPQHERFIFDGWASPIELTDNTFVMPGQDVFIGASYYTASGATEIDIELNKATGLTFTFNDVLSGVTSIDWGDGSSGNTLTHTYSSYGNYTIKIYGMTAIASSSGGGITGDSSNSNATITGIFFSESVTSIGNYAFTSCRSLETVVIPSGITSIGTHVFYTCYGLSTVIMRSGIKGVGGYSFYDCYHLKTAILSNGITSISDQAFRDCSSLTHIVFPNGLGAIYANAFYGCRSLERVILPDSVTTLGNYTFAYCYRLRDVKLPSGLKVIPFAGFLQCQGLYRIAIPGSVTSVSAGSFDQCTNMKECDFTACTAIPKLAQNTAFNNCSDLMKILVPSSLYSSWIIASTWSSASIANKIVAV